MDNGRAEKYQAWSPSETRKEGKLEVKYENGDWGLILPSHWNFY